MISGKNKQLYYESSIDKQLNIEVIGTKHVIDNSMREQDTFALAETLNDGTELKFGSCLPNQISFTGREVPIATKGMKLRVAETLEGNENDPFVYGTYTVQSDTPTADRTKRQITAYDAMYDIINADVKSWYDGLTFPMTLRQFRDSFFSHLGIEQKEASLVNDEMTVNKTLTTTQAEDSSVTAEATISGKTIIEAICEINGAFGNIGRDGRFEYVILKAITSALYPAEDLYPREDLFPSDANTESMTGHYITFDYEAFQSQAITQLEIRADDSTAGAIVGTSGSGKSTLLRCLNRLIRPTSGEIIINGTDISKVSSKELLEIRRKELSMVFQHFGLLPHRTVLQNIAFGLELQGIQKNEREKTAMDCMQQVGLIGYENQLVSQLSGGMQQRVGLARALANNPEVLLMDEAFSALDPLIRVQMQDELLQLQTKMKKTIIFITHDLSEAIKLGDRIAIMKDGEIVQVGTSEEILTEPANEYVERFVENVDRSKIITASSIMIDKPVVARFKKEGPEVLIRKMRQRNLISLPVVDDKDVLIGEVLLNDLLELRKEGVRSIDTVIQTEVHSVLSDTVVEDILPLMTKTNSPIWVVNEQREFQGVIPLSSLIIEVTGKDKKEINEIIQNAIEL